MTAKETVYTCKRPLTNDRRAMHFVFCGHEVALVMVTKGKKKGERALIKWGPRVPHMEIDAARFEGMREGPVWSIVAWSYM